MYCSYYRLDSSLPLGSLIKSELDKIQGVGPSKKHALLKQFGSVKRIKTATPEQIAELNGINIKLANAILSELKIT